MWITKRALAPCLVIILLASLLFTYNMSSGSLFTYNMSSGSSNSAIVIQTDYSGSYKDANVSKTEVLAISTNTTYVQEPPVQSVENKNALVMTEDDTWNPVPRIPSDIFVEERSQEKVTALHNVQNIENGLTNIFGFAIQTEPDIITYFYRQGTTHAHDKGNLVKRDYSISNGSWSEAYLIYSNPVLDSRNIAGGIIDQKIYLFFYRYNYTWGSARGSDVGYIVSTDLTGSSWSTYVPLVNNTIGSPYGTLVQKGDSSTWFVGFYSDRGNTSRIRLITTEDNGETWSVKHTVYNGTIRYAEPSIAYLGNNRMLTVAREDNFGPLHQFISIDGGENWTDSGPMNLGTRMIQHANIPSILYNGNTLYTLWADRGTAKILLSESSDEVFNNPMTYNTPVEIGAMTNTTAIYKSGYPSQVLLSNGDLFYVYGNAVDDYKVDIMSGIVKND